jgi:putative ABC transport system permease protein
VRVWRSLIAGVRVLRNRDAADRDVADEVRHYYDEATAQFIAAGMTPDEARRAARIALGDMTVAQEEIRSFGWVDAADALRAG